MANRKKSNKGGGVGKWRLENEEMLVEEVGVGDLEWRLGVVISSPYERKTSGYVKSLIKGQASMHLMEAMVSLEYVGRRNGSHTTK